MLCPFFQAQEKQVWMHPNRGQWHENIRYKIDLQNGECLIEQNAFTYVFHNVGELKHDHAEDGRDHPHQKINTLAQNQQNFRQHVVKSTFLGSNPDHGVAESESSDFYRNYFLGNDPSKWRNNVRALSKVAYPGFYNGVAMFLEGGNASLKYSFILEPHADPSLIRYRIEGADEVHISKNGSLSMRHSFGEINESKPIAWTLDEKGRKTAVELSYKLENDIVSFYFPEGYNTNDQLVIDPEITFSSYTGSTADNWGCTATPDSQGNLFAGGTVFGIGYPTTPGALDASFNGGDNIGYSGFDVALSKFNANGTAFLYSTYLGGTGSECPNSMIVNENNELYIMGVTSSSNFPVPGASFDNSFNGGTSIELNSTLGFNGTDIYVIRINPGGTAVLNATYVGGSGNDGVNVGSSSFQGDGDLVFNYGDNYRGEIILDSQGNVLVASSTRSGNFPLVSPSQAFLNGLQDAVLFKLNPALSVMMWSTYYGGSNLDCGNAVAINSANEVYLTGGTISPNLVVPGAQSPLFGGGEADGFVTRFNGGNGAILSGTYIGTGLYDQSFFVQVDINDFVYVYGQTFGAMPISPGLVGNANARQFIRKFNTALSAVAWNTKIGGNEHISPTAFLVSDCFEIYLAGWGGVNLGSDISSFVTTPDAFQTSTDGDGFYIAVLDPEATGLQYATFMGGPGGDHVDGGTSRFDKAGNIYHAVCSACGGLDNGFVSTPGVVSSTNKSDNCNMAAFKFELNTITAVVLAPGAIVCIPNPIQFMNNSSGGDTYLWDFGDGNTSTLPDPSHVYTDTGDYIVKLVVFDSQGCKTPDSTTVTVSVRAFEAAMISNPPVICKGTPHQLEVAGGLFYSWSPANVLDDPNIPNPVATVFQTTTFTVIVADSCGSDTLTVTIEVFDDEISVSPDTSICRGFDAQIQVFGSASQVWTPDQFINDNTLTNPLVSPEETTYYVVTATTPNGCVYRDSVLVDVFFELPAPVMIDSATLCFGTSLDIIVSGAVTYSWSPNQHINTTTGNTVIVSPTSDITYYVDFTNACGTIRDSVFINVIVPRITASNDTIICLGESAYLSASGANTYLWSPATGLNSINTPDVIATPQVNTNYLVIGTDSSGCRDSANVYVQLFPVNYVEAGANVIAQIGQSVQLHAESDVPGTYIWLPESFLTCSVCQDPVASPDYNFTYTVLFTDTNGCVTSDLVDINYKGILYVPNSFTPDGSKFNEVFKAYGEGIDNFEMLIFNRWGELICTLKSMDEFWDGRYMGKMCQDGTYTWKITYADISGEYKTITGHVNLLK